MNLLFFPHWTFLLTYTVFGLFKMYVFIDIDTHTHTHTIEIRKYG